MFNLNFQEIGMFFWIFFSKSGAKRYIYFSIFAKNSVGNRITTKVLGAAIKTELI